jgi:transcriptional regulator with XRE-family HTH domain
VSKLSPATKKRLEALGEHLRLTRRSLGVSRAKLADSIGMHVANYARIERGKKNVTVDTLLRIATGLGVDLVMRLEQPER